VGQSFGYRSILAEERMSLLLSTLLRRLNEWSPERGSFFNKFKMQRKKLIASPRPPRHATMRSHRREGKDELIASSATCYYWISARVFEKKKRGVAKIWDYNVDLGLVFPNAMKHVHPKLKQKIA
jgi:hypothetical protein